MATAAAAVPKTDLDSGVHAPDFSIGSVERVQLAMGILKTIKASDVQIETKAFFTPLYTATALQRANQDIHATGIDEVVRKNLYFMAEKIKNTQALLIQLVQRGFLNLTERENVMKQQDQFLRAVEMLIIIVKKDSRRYKLLLDIFRDNGNEEITNILSNAALEENIGPNPPLPTATTPCNVQPTSEPKPQKPKEEKSWNCLHCTFQNKGGIICVMCAKTNDHLAPLSPRTPSTPTDTRTRIIGCKMCTFLNEEDSENCVICGDNLKQ